MGKKKKVEAVVDEAPVVAPAPVDTSDGEKDPYSEGKHMENPEPNNNAANRPTKDAPVSPVYNPGLAAPHDSPNLDEAEQNRVAKGRKEK